MNSTLLKSNKTQHRKSSRAGPVFAIGLACMILVVMASRVAGFAALAPLNTPRSQHTATLLNNGKVLVAGGSQTGVANSMSSVELYDPVANTWTVVASLNGERRSHTATLLSDGRVLVAGGFVGSLSFAVNTAEIYDPANNIWSAAGNLVTPRGNHTATLLGNGRVLVAGGTGTDLSSAEGNSTALNSAEVYDLATNAWSAAGGLVQERHHHSATLLASGRVLVTGGLTHSGAATLSVECFEPSIGAWFQLAPMNTPRSHHTATVLSNGTVLVTGGWLNGAEYLSTTEIYDPAGNAWEPGPGMGTTRGSHTATLLNDGRVLVAGGTNGTALKWCELYDPASQRWMLAGYLLFVRAEFTATLFPNGKVLLAGGNPQMYMTELYDELANQGPGILSGPTAAPNPAFTNTVVAFNVVAADPENEVLSCTWDFGDGSAGSGANTSHIYTVGGMFTATVTVSDGINPPVSDTLAVTLNSTLLLTVTKAKVKLNFSRIDADSMSFSGIMEVSAMFDPKWAQITFDIGGVTRSLQLNEKASASNIYDSIKITLLKNRSQTLSTLAKYKATFTHGNFKVLANSGMVNADTRRSVTVPFKIAMNGATMTAVKGMDYTGKLRKVGTAN